MTSKRLNHQTQPKPLPPQLFIQEWSSRNLLSKALFLCKTQKNSLQIALFKKAGLKSFAF